MPQKPSSKPVAEYTWTTWLGTKGCAKIYDRSFSFTKFGPYKRLGPVQPKPPWYYQKLLGLRAITWLIIGLAGVTLTTVATIFGWTPF